MTRLLTTIIALLSFNTAAYATSNEVMLDMIEFIEQNSKYEYNGEKLPYIQIRTNDELCRSIFEPEVYERVKEDCTVAGYYDHNTNAIFIADAPAKYMVEEGFIEIVLLHELVHFLQLMNGEYDKVACKNELEADAYILQRKYVDHMGYPEEQKPDPLFAMITSSCPPDQFWEIP